MSYEQTRRARPDLGVAAIGRLVVDPAVAERNAAILAVVADETELPLLPNPRLGLPYFTEQMLRRRGFCSFDEAAALYNGRFSNDEIDVTLEHAVHFNSAGMITRTVSIPKVLREEMRGYGGAVRGHMLDTLNPLGQSNDGMGVVMRVGQLASHCRRPSADWRAEVNEALMDAPWGSEQVTLAPHEIFGADARWRQLDQAAAQHAMPNLGARDA